jgi:hypothetical protein
MFFTDHRVLTTSISAARVRLAELVDDGWLSTASEHAYRDGLDHLLWSGPAGSVPGVSRLAGVRYTEPVHQARSVTRGMRWEITGVTGGLFPALDADITLHAHGEDATRTTLTGVYRLPVGPLGGGLDRALLRAVTTTTIHSLITRLSTVLDPARGRT